MVFIEYCIFETRIQKSHYIKYSSDANPADVGTIQIKCVYTHHLSRFSCCVSHIRNFWNMAMNEWRQWPSIQRQQWQRWRRQEQVRQVFFNSYVIWRLLLLFAWAVGLEDTSFGCPCYNAMEEGARRDDFWCLPNTGPRPLSSFCCSE